MVAYGTSAGHPALVAWIAEKHGVAPEQVIATNGSMQADAFLFKRLVEPGDVVVVEAPSYDRTLLALRDLGAELLAIPLEADGIDVEALARALEGGARPKLAHVIPNFHNPGGCTLSLEKRRRLFELGAEYGFTVFEDDPYVDIRFAGEPLPTMFSLDERDVVVYASSFSKTVCPGIRVGLPGRARGADRRDPRHRHQHLHLAEHGGPGDRGRVLQLRGDRPLDRHRQGGACASGATCSAQRSSASCPTRASWSPRAATSSGSSSPRAPTRPASPKPRRSAAWCSSRAADFLIEGGENAFRIAYSGVTPELIEEGVSRLAEAYRELATRQRCGLAPVALAREHELLGQRRARRR